VVKALKREGSRLIESFFEQRAPVVEAGRRKCDEWTEIQDGSTEPNLNVVQRGVSGRGSGLNGRRCRPASSIQHSAFSIQHFSILIGDALVESPLLNSRSWILDSEFQMLDAECPAALMRRG